MSSSTLRIIGVDELSETHASNIVLGDSLARGLLKQMNRDHSDRLLARLKHKKFAPPSLRFGVVKRARLKWLQDAGAVLIGTITKKRSLQSLWLVPLEDGSWCEIHDIITPDYQDSKCYVARAVTAHAAQRLVQAQLSIYTAARVRRLALFSGGNVGEHGTLEYATDEGLWRFDAWSLVTFIPLRALDPRVLERWASLKQQQQQKHAGHASR